MPSGQCPVERKKASGVAAPNSGHGGGGRSNEPYSADDDSIVNTAQVQRMSVEEADRSVKDMCRLVARYCYMAPAIATHKDSSRLRDDLLHLRASAYELARINKAYLLPRIKQQQVLDGNGGPGSAGSNSGMPGMSSCEDIYDNRSGNVTSGVSGGGRRIENIFYTFCACLECLFEHLIRTYDAVSSASRQAAAIEAASRVTVVGPLNASVQGESTGYKSAHKHRSGLTNSKTVTSSSSSSTAAHSYSRHSASHRGHGSGGSNSGLGTTQVYTGVTEQVTAAALNRINGITLPSHLLHPNASSCFIAGSAKDSRRSSVSPNQQQQYSAGGGSLAGTPHSNTTFPDQTGDIPIGGLHARALEELRGLSCDLQAVRDMIFEIHSSVSISPWVVCPELDLAKLDEVGSLTSLDSADSAPSNHLVEDGRLRNGGGGASEGNRIYQRLFIIRMIHQRCLCLSLVILTSIILFAVVLGVCIHMLA